MTEPELWQTHIAMGEAQGLTWDYDEWDFIKPSKE